MRRLTFVSILVSLSLLALGCGKQSAAPKTSTGPKLPAPEIRQAKPVAIPQSEIPGGGKVPVYLKIREPRKTLERVSDWTSATQPMLTADVMAQKIEAIGIPISKFTPGDNALAAVWPQMNSVQVGGVLPLNEPADLSRLGVQTEPITGGGLLFGMDSTGRGMAQVKAASEDLLKIQKAAIGSDLELAADIQSMWQVYGPLARMALPSLINGIMSGGQMRGQPQMTPGVQAILTTEAAAAMDLLDQVRDTAFRVNFDKDALELSVTMSAIVTQDGGTTLSKFLSAEPVAAPELTKFVSRNPIVGQMTIRDMGKMMDLYANYLAMAMPEVPDAAKKLREQFAGVEKIGTMHTAGGVSMAPDSAMHIEYVMVADHPDELMKLVHEKIQAINAGPLHDLYLNLDMDMRVTTEPLKREYKGYTVEKYSFRVTPGPNAGEVDRQMMAKMFPGDIAVELAQVGPYTVSVMGQPADSLIDRVLTPEGRSPARSVMTFPAGAIFYVDYDLISYLRAARETIPGLAALHLPESAPPVLVAGYHQQGKAYYVVRIPRKTIIAFSGIAQESSETTGTQQTITPGHE